MLTIDEALANINTAGQLCVIAGYLEMASRGTGLTPSQCRKLAAHLDLIASDLGAEAIQAGQSTDVSAGRD